MTDKLKAIHEQFKIDLEREVNKALEQANKSANVAFNKAMQAIRAIKENPIYKFPKEEPLQQSTAKCKKTPEEAAADFAAIRSVSPHYEDEKHLYPNDERVHEKTDFEEHNTYFKGGCI